VKLKTSENVHNLDEHYEEDRRSVLTEAQARVYMDAEWEDLTEGTPYLETMQWWDDCKEALPEPTKQEPLVIALDAAKTSDVFGLVGVSRHPSREDALAVRLVRAWVPQKGKGALNYEEIESEIEFIAKSHNVIQIAYDPNELHHMMTRMRHRRIAHTAEFSQQGERLRADRGLIDLIQQRRVAHDGHIMLREHLKNADRKLEADGRNIRIVKRAQSRKIDLAVCLSMACHRALELWIDNGRVEPLPDHIRAMFENFRGR
jgi:phage terminase large subunit-like protein